jgi:hypothetical protein
MQANSVNQHREIRKDELLRIAPFSKRQLAEAYRAGWLPRPQRRSYPGSKKPVYYWDASVIDQATMLYGLLRWYRVDQRVRLPLWLRGYQVDFAPLRQGWLDSIDAYLEVYTQGNGEDDDPADEPEDHISRVIVELKDKWKHIPASRRPEDLQRLGLEAMAQGMELFLGLLLVPGYELNETTFAEVLARVSTAGKPPQGEFHEGFTSWLSEFQEVLALPRVREAIEQATPEAWEQARSDYLTLCEFAQILLAPVAQIHPVPQEMYVLLFGAVGSHLVPVALALRYWEYGEWIDEMFASMSDNLDEIDYEEERAWIAEQLVQRRAKSPG